MTLTSLFRATGLVTTVVLSVACRPASAEPPDADSKACEVDSDCVVSCSSIGDCCGQGCQCTHVYNQDHDKAVREWQSENCGEAEHAECPVYSCPMPTTEIVAYCEHGQCRSKEVPLAEDEQSLDEDEALAPDPLPSDESE